MLSHVYKYLDLFSKIVQNTRNVYLKLKIKERVKEKSEAFIHALRLIFFEPSLVILKMRNALGNG
jgi:hypothetical protein